MPSSFDAVIFDNDGLLLDTEVAWTRAEQDLFERYGQEFTMEHKRSLLGNAKSVAESKLETMLALPGEGRRLLDELEELVMEEALAGVPPRPGAVELLESAVRAGLPVGLASNSSRAFVERTIGVSGIDVTSFGVLVTADEVEHPKPAPGPVPGGLLRAEGRSSPLGGARGLAAGHQLRPGCRAVRDRGALLRGPDARRRLAPGFFPGRPERGRGARSGLVISRRRMRGPEA